MFHLLNKNLNIQLIFLVILAGWSGWLVFSQMSLIPQEGSMLMFQHVASWWTNHNTVARIFVFAMVLIMTIGIISHFNKNHFHESRTYMPGVFFLLLLNCGKFLHYLTPSLLTIFFISLILLMNSPNESSAQLKNRIFTFGLTIALATLLDISAFGIILFLILMISINNVTSIKDNIILFTGLLIPYIYAFAISYIVGTLPVFVQSWRDLALFEPIRQISQLRIIDYVTLAFFILTIILFIIRDKRFLDNKLIIIRQAFTNNHLLLFSMLVFLFLGNVVFPIALTYLVLPLSIYMAIAVIPKRRCLLVDILIVALCVLLWL
jgi:hypothetical protein